MVQPTVLLYNLDTPKGMKIKLLCLPLKLRVRAVRREEYTETLAALTGREGPVGTPYEGEGFPEEMLVMAGLTTAQMNGFLQGFRKKKIPPVYLKAVLTETNLRWDSLRLHDELRREDRAMRLGVETPAESGE